MYSQHGKSYIKKKAQETLVAALGSLRLQDTVLGLGGSGTKSVFCKHSRRGYIANQMLNSIWALNSSTFFTQKPSVGMAESLTAEAAP